VNLCRRRLYANRDSHCHTSRLKQIAFSIERQGRKRLDDAQFQILFDLIRHRFRGP